MSTAAEPIPMETGFATTPDGDQLYWRAIGRGKPIVCCNGVGVGAFFWKYIAMHFQHTHRVILWDYPGHGLSTDVDDPVHADLSIPKLASDLQIVLDAIGVTEPAVLFGHSMGCQVILEAHLQAPERVAALIPMFGTFGHALDTFFGGPWAHAALPVIRGLLDRSSRRTLRTLLPIYASPVAFAFSRYTGIIDKDHAKRIDMDHYMAHLQRIHPRTFVRTVELMADHDLSWHLSDIHVPTLIFGGKNDLFTPIDRSTQMAEQIPGAELCILDDGSHAAIVEHPKQINRKLDAFFEQHGL